jgi:hypothetical protein
MHALIFACAFHSLLSQEEKLFPLVCAVHCIQKIAFEALVKPHLYGIIKAGNLASNMSSRCKEHQKIVGPCVSVVCPEILRHIVA